MNKMRSKLINAGPGYYLQLYFIKALHCLVIFFRLWIYHIALFHLVLSVQWHLLTSDIDIHTVGPDKNSLKVTILSQKGSPDLPLLQNNEFKEYFHISN